MELVELHNHPEYINACCNILNNEWKRSHAARYHSLSKSCSNLPVSLALVRHKEGLDGQVVGHAKLCRVLQDDKACFVESVIVIPEERGKGFGKLVMKLTEEYARKFQAQWTTWTGFSGSSTANQMNRFPKTNHLMMGLHKKSAQSCKTIHHLPHLPLYCPHHHCKLRQLSRCG
ncbi:N-alpha-acetyltransferase 80 isoform X3 [Dermacentor silvarum]|uniref:N-alpha-acetyltransferase 80 isoform X3 n=1 Tax=Dermacentor silvarum TaxID=543639 RepID=UPI0018991171|nr:N-alpha-acetyltransferase 80 isoform X3 [Dermacentor silvarum]